MVSWFGSGRRGNSSPDEPEEQNVSEESGPELEASSEPEWAPSVLEVELDIDGKAFKALSLYELPGVAVIAAQQTAEHERLPALWGLMQLALPQDGVDRMSVLGFTKFQEVIFSWTMLSAKVAAEEYQKRGTDMLKKILGDEPEGGSGGSDGEGPGRKFF